MPSRPTSVLVFEVVGVATYAGLLIDFSLFGEVDLFTLAFYGALIALVLAVSRLRQSWARIANTVVIVLSVGMTPLILAPLLEMSGEAIFGPALGFLILITISYVVQLFALWRGETGAWLKAEHCAPH